MNRILLTLLPINVGRQRFWDRIFVPLCVFLRWYGRSELPLLQRAVPNTTSSTWGRLQHFRIVHGDNSLHPTSSSRLCQYWMEVSPRLHHTRACGWLGHVEILSRSESCHDL